MPRITKCVILLGDLSSLDSCLVEHHVRIIDNRGVSCQIGECEAKLTLSQLAVLFATTFWTFLYEVPARSQMNPQIETHCVGPAILALRTIARNSLPPKHLCCLLCSKEAE